MKKLFKTLISVLVIVGIVMAVPYITDCFFPETYERQVRQCSEEYGVPKNLIMAIIKAESNFRKEALSQKGAKGLMQVMDETGEWCAEKIGISSPDLFDVETNIRIGTFYVSYLLEKYGGNEKTAVAAYNAGQGNVSKWLEDKDYSSNGTDLSKIPFEERNLNITSLFILGIVSETI